MFFKPSSPESPQSYEIQSTFWTRLLFMSLLCFPSPVLIMSYLFFRVLSFPSALALTCAHLFLGFFWSCC